MCYLCPRSIHLYKGECFVPPMHINLRDFNPVRGEMSIEPRYKQYLQLRQERHVRIPAKTDVAPTELDV